MHAIWLILGIGRQNRGFNVNRNKERPQKSLRQSFYRTTGDQLVSNNLYGINASASSLLLNLTLARSGSGQAEDRRDEMRSLYLLKSRTPSNYKSLFSIMDNGDSGRKLTGIRQIVRLKGILKRWRSVAVTSRSNTPVCSSHRKTHSTGSIYSMPKILNKRLESIKSFGDSDEDSVVAGGGCQSPDMPLHVPKGYLAVYVGEELRRFLIPTDYLSHPLFKVILEKVEEEFGFDHTGGLTIPCEIETFKYLLQCMENQNKANHHADHDNNAEAA